MELGPGTLSRFYYMGSRIKLSEEVKQVTSELWHLLGAGCQVCGREQETHQRLEITLRGAGGGYLPGCATSELQGDGQVTSMSELHLLLIK